MDGRDATAGPVDEGWASVKKLILLLVIFAGASATVPALRQRVEPRVVPVWDAGLRWVGPAVHKVVDPAFRWSARNEARQIARTLRQAELSYVALPDPKEFQRYLERRYRGGREGLDPWDRPYYLIVTPDSIVVGSAGPDTTRATADDVRVSVGRR